MRMTSFLALAAVTAMVLAGCFSAAPNPRQAVLDAKEQVDAAARHVLALDHGEAENAHFNATLHAGAYNMQLVGYSNGVDNSGDPDHIPAAGYYNELAVTPQHAYLSANSVDGSYGGLSIIDIQDPANPHVLSHFNALGGADVDVNPDETLAFFATQRNSADQVAGHLQSSQDASTAAPRGIYVLDIRDKSNPLVDSFTPLPSNGPHTLTFVRHPNGNDYLLVCTYDLITDPGTGAIVGAVPATQRMTVFLVSYNPLPPPPPPAPALPMVSLQPVAQFQVFQAKSGKLIFPHDARAQAHPLQDGRFLIYLAYWDMGVRILDFSHPPAPAADGANLPTLAEVSSFTDFAPSAFDNIHLAKPFETLQDGKHVTVAEPEIISAPDETGQITLIDTTDPSHPAKLGSWTLPVQSPPLGVTDLDFSPHNFDTWGSRIALAHYHAGVWVLDASGPEGLAHPTEVGFYMPAMARAHSPVYQPEAWSVLEQGGLLFASDEASGLYILNYTGP